MLARYTGYPMSSGAMPPPKDDQKFSFESVAARITFAKYCDVTNEAFWRKRGPRALSRA